MSDNISLNCRSIDPGIRWFETYHPDTHERLTIAELTKWAPRPESGNLSVPAYVRQGSTGPLLVAVHRTGQIRLMPQEPEIIRRGTDGDGMVLNSWGHSYILLTPATVVVGGWFNNGLLSLPPDWIAHDTQLGLAI